MTAIDVRNREIWNVLFAEDCKLTVCEIADRIDQSSEVVFRDLCAMVRCNFVNVYSNPKDRRLSYSIDGTCLMPKGLRLAEVQA